jgi:EAL domain-containing protein (putative c-di-GMP-specific phosphodiesterase class I)
MSRRAVAKAEAWCAGPTWRGAVPPPEFISLAEETGMIVPLTRAVIEQVCRHRLGDALPPDFRVSINLSGSTSWTPS